MRDMKTDRYRELKICPLCGKRALMFIKTHKWDFCCPFYEGCGRNFNIIIESPGLMKGIALERYTCRDGKYSYFGEFIHNIKYDKNISDINKHKMINTILTEIEKRIDISAFVNNVLNLLIVPIPSSNKDRNIQHVYEIAKGIAKFSNYKYSEALLKNTSKESKSMQVNEEYEDGDFSCIYNVQGRSILLIDDTFGTGATLRACIKELEKCGARSIYFLSLCKNTGGGIKKHGAQTISQTDDDDILPK